MPLRFKRLIGGTELNALSFPVAANQTIAKWDPVKLVSGKVTKAAAADTALLGVSLTKITTGATPAATEIAEVIMQPGVIYTVPYTAGTKTTLAQTDVATVFGITDTGTLNLDDTTAGVIAVVGFDNTKKTADVLITARSLY